MFSKISEEASTMSQTALRLAKTPKSVIKSQRSKFESNISYRILTKPNYLVYTPYIPLIDHYYCVSTIFPLGFTLNISYETLGETSEN